MKSKRGKKLPPKPKPVTRADKNHLRRILKKARAIRSYQLATAR